MIEKINAEGVVFMPEELIYRKRRLSSFKIIILGFAGVILLGALLLMLPISTTGGNVTPFNETLFTSTSAVCNRPCCAGYRQLLVNLWADGYSGADPNWWSWCRNRSSIICAVVRAENLLMQRSTMQDAISAPKVGGIVRLTRFILRGTFLIELLGALAMLPVFCRDYGWRGIWMAVFHSVSAFCNAGFDILGTGNNLYPSLTSYAGSPIINITIMLLIVTGGIGFLTWDDICENKLHFHHYRMQSKVILVTTAFLLVLPAIFFFFVDFSSLPIGKRVLASFFQSVTPRTAGFNTVILSDMTGASQAVMIFLMMIGGSPGSTAGGMKTTTLAVLVANAAATFRQHESVQFFGRRIECGVVKTAATVVTMYLALFLAALFLSAYMKICRFPRACMKRLRQSEQ